MRLAPPRTRTTAAAPRRAHNQNAKHPAISKYTATAKTATLALTSRAKQQRTLACPGDRRDQGRLGYRQAQRRAQSEGSDRTDARPRARERWSRAVASSDRRSDEGRRLQLLGVELAENASVKRPSRRAARASGVSVHAIGGSAMSFLSVYRTSARTSPRADHDALTDSSRDFYPCGTYARRSDGETLHLIPRHRRRPVQTANRVLKLFRGPTRSQRSTGVNPAIATLGSGNLRIDAGGPCAPNCRAHDCRGAGRCMFRAVPSH